MATQPHQWALATMQGWQGPESTGSPGWAQGAQGWLVGSTGPKGWEMEAAPLSNHGWGALFVTWLGG